jgi:hypothetical protein
MGQMYLERPVAGAAGERGQEQAADQHQSRANSGSHLSHQGRVHSSQGRVQLSQGRVQLSGDN